jgi:hypothetical protein
LITVTKIKGLIMTINKGGRPAGSGSTWQKPTTTIRVPVEYAEALKEIAKEWQAASSRNRNY